jgi:UDP-N-acetylglucosamine 2-epimerase (non-hydrolysing)
MCAPDLTKPPPGTLRALVPEKVSAYMSNPAPRSGPLVCVVGARPNFMKMAPILRACQALTPPLPTLLVHTGQHYDRDMSDRLFEDLRLPHPDINLEVGSGTHAVQTAEVMRRFEPVLDEHQPCGVLVVGDVNSTLACTLVAVKKAVPVVHVEAGLRSGDRTMPEEINRVLTDQIADRLYTTERSAETHLRREGIAPERVCFVGNVMIRCATTLRRRATGRPPCASMNRIRRCSSGRRATPSSRCTVRPTSTTRPRCRR